MRSDKLYKVWLVLLAAVFVASAVQAQWIDVSKIKEKAKKNGEVAVIVTFHLPGGFVPEGRLTGQQIAQQRKAIADNRKALKDSLIKFKPKVYREWQSIPSIALKVDAATLDYLASSPLVISIEEDSLSPPSMASTGRLIGSDLTWAAGYGGKGQTVVILDTGIDANHPFFGDRVKWQACFSNGGGGGVSLCTNGAAGGNAADVTVGAMADANHCDTTGANHCAHGSHVAGIAAGRDPGGTGATGYSGVAPEADIVAIQVFTRFNGAGDCGSGGPPCVLTYASDQMSALDYVNTTVRGPYAVSSVNMSLGSGMNADPCDGDSRKAGIDNLLTNGIATCIASGNDGYTNALGAPGCVSTAVTVGGVYDGNPCGSMDEVTWNMSKVVDLLAVGRCVDSSIPDDAWGLDWGGTSMATPQVTGAFAVIKGIDGARSVADTLALLQSTGVLATDNRAPNPADAMSGITKPRLDLAAAVASITRADLQVTKTCKPDGTVNAGEVGTCTITVNNWGPDAALDVNIVDQMVSNGTFSVGSVTITPAAGANCTVTGPVGGSGQVACTVQAIAAGGVVTITVPVTASEAQDINDTATVYSLNDPDITNNVAKGTQNVGAAADLRITKQASAEEQQVNQKGLIFNSAIPGQSFPTGPNYFASTRVTAGRRIQYTLTVTNDGPSTATNVLLADRLPSGVRIYQGSLTAPAGVNCETGTPGQVLDRMICGIGNLAPGASATISFQAVSDAALAAGTVLENDALVSSDAYDPDTGNNYANTQNTVLTAADMSVTKTGMGKVLTAYNTTSKQYVYTDTANQVSAGASIRYTISVQNNGPSDARNVTVKDILPSGVLFSNASGATCMPDAVNGNIIYCYLDDMTAGARKTFDVFVSLDPSLSDGATIPNSAEVLYAPSNTSPPGPPPGLPPGYPAGPVTWDPDSSDNLAGQTTTVLVNYDLAITKTSDADTYKPSSTVKYTIAVTNRGPSDVDEVTVTDNLPPPKQAKYLWDNGGCLWDKAKTLTCTIGPMAPDETKQFDVYVTVLGSQGTVSNTAVISGGAVPFDVYGANNSSTRSIILQGKKSQK